MTPRRTIKVRMTVTVELDPAEWAEANGCESDEVRQDVRDYFANHIGHAQAIEDASLAVRVA